MVKVAIVEDIRDIREGLRVLINGTDGFQCTGVFRTMEEGLDGIPRDLPDVVLLDIGLPGMSGIQGIGALKQKYPQLPIIMLTVYESPDRIFEALCSGASGYLLKKTPPARLLESIREAIGGGAPMSPEVASRVLSIFRDIHPPERSREELTPHEVRLLGLIAEGHSYRTAATRLGVSVNTIKFHLRQIYSKLEVHSKSEAVAKALRSRLIG